MNTSRILSVGIAALVALPITARAVDYHWVANPGNNNWLDAANWDAVPLSGGGNRIFVHTNGSFNILGPAIDAGLLILAVGNAGDPLSGYTFGAGTYNVGTIYIGENKNADIDAIALNNGYGRAFINSGTTINVGSFHLGEWDGASGHVVQSGGDLNIAGQFRLGHWPQAGGTSNSYTMNGGTISMTGGPGDGSEGSGGAFILGVDSSGTFNMNAGTLNAHGITMQTRVAGGGQSFFNMNGGVLNVGVNGFKTNDANNLGSYDINLGGGTVRSTANWNSALEMHVVSGGSGVNFDTNGFNVTLSGQLNGAGGLTKSGTGTLVLNHATNSYSGPTVISGGTLQLTASGALPTSDITVQSGAGLRLDTAGKTLLSLGIEGGSTFTLGTAVAQTINVTNALTFTSSPNFTVRPLLTSSPAVNDTFDLLTAGSVVGLPGTITTDFGLSHAQGTTALVGSKLVLTITSAGGNLTWNNAAATGVWNVNGDVNWQGADGKFLPGDEINFTDLATGTITLVGALDPAVTKINATGSHTFNGSGKITGAGALIKSNTGTLTINTLNDYTGGTTINAGVVELAAQDNGIAAIRGTVTINAGGELRGAGGNATFGYNTGQKIDTFNVNGGLLNTGAGAEHVWGATVNMTGGELRSNGGVNDPGGTQFEWGGSTLNTLASASTALVNGRIRVRPDAGFNFVINTADGPAATDLLVNAAINQTGNYRLGKLGPGIAEMTGNVTAGSSIQVVGGELTFSGNAVVNTDFLVVGSTANLSGLPGEGSGIVNVRDNANVTTRVVSMGENFGGAFQNNVINQSGAGSSVTVTGDHGENISFRLGHWPNETSTYNLSAGTLTLQTFGLGIATDGTGVFNQSGGTLNTPQVVVNHRNGGGDATFALTGGIANVGAGGFVTAGGPAALRLGGGTIRATANLAIATAAELTGTNGDVTFDTNGNNIDVPAGLFGAGGFTKTGAGRLVLNSANTATGIFTVNDGVVSALGAHATNRIPANGIVLINNGGTFEFGSPNVVNFNSNYVIGAGGTLTNAAGVDHVHVGSLLLNGGTWTTDPAAASYHGENYQIHGAVTVAGSVPSIITQQGGNASNRGIAWDGNTIFTVNDATSDAATDLTVSTELENADTGSAALTKSGAGTMNVTFANSYSGGTTVTDGTLRVNNLSGSATGTGNVTVDAGGRLAGAGTVGAGGGISASISGRIAPGNSAGTLAFNLGAGGTLDISNVGAGNLEFELGTTSDLVALTSGSLNIGTGVLEFDDFNFTQLSGFASGDYVLFDSTTAIVGTLGANVTGALPGDYIGTLQFADGGNDLILHVVPEPGTALLLLSGLGLLGIRRRRA